MSGKSYKLDDLETTSLLELIFLFPGRAVLWINYMNPKGGVREVFLSRRYAKSEIIVKTISTVFWLALGLGLMETIYDFL